MRSIKFLAAAVLALAALPVVAQRGPTGAATQAAGRSPPPLAARPDRIALTAHDVNAWLDGYIPYGLKTGDIAGALVVVVKDGAILTSRGFGYSDVAKRRPVDPRRTLFRPGSVGKLFTWTAVMQQVEQGKIDLDADINRYLDFRIPARGGQPITMRNLMQHTPGFEEYVKNGVATDPKKAVSYEKWLKQWTPRRIFPAGVTPAYSNYGAALGGYIVQRVSGEPFDAYIERHIFAPLSMARSTFRQPLPAKFAPFMSTGYDLASGDPKRFEIFGMAPAGSLSSTGDDMARFMIAHLQNGAFNNNRILRPETATMMHNSPLTVLPPLHRMKLGFLETGINGREVIGHHGDTQYYHTSLHLLKSEGVGFYVSLNSTGKGGAAGGLRIALFENFADRYFPGGAGDGRVDAKTAAAHARMMAGNWEVSRRMESSFLNVTGFLGQFKIGVGPEGELVMPFRGLDGELRNWVEIAPFVWRDAASHQRFAAKVVDGRVVRVSFDLAAPVQVWDRAPWYKNTAWLLPLFCAGLAALAMTVLLWPAAAIVRWRYGATLVLEPRALRAFRLSRIAATGIVVALAGWAGVLALVFSDADNQNAGSDLALWLIQIFSAIALIGGFALMLWNLWVVWTGKRRWPAKVWSVVLALSALTVLWVAIAFKLLAFTVNY